MTVSFKADAQIGESNKFLYRHGPVFSAVRCNGRFGNGWRYFPAALIGSVLFLSNVISLIASRCMIGAEERYAMNGGVAECICNPSVSKERGNFIIQRDFDVCKVACTSGNRLAFSSSEAEVVASGYEIMASSVVEVCILCRDAVGLLPNLTRRMRTLAGKFKSTHISVIENDSKDDTVEKFRKWADFERRDGILGLSVDIEHHKLMLERRPILITGYDSADYAAQRTSRYHRLSLLRNRCLMQAMKRSHIDFLIVVDVDDDVDDEAGDIDGIAHSYGLKRHAGNLDWEVVCSNSVLRQPPGVTASLYRNYSEPVPEVARRWVFRDSLAFRDGVFDLDTFRFHERRIHTPYDEPYYVQSCFGGLAIYDLSRKHTDWHVCSYEAFKDDDCEHVSFHKCLGSLGWRILFNPRMTVQYH
jgi:hypothetical protein